MLNVALAAVAGGCVALGIITVGPPAAPKAQPRLVSVSTGAVASTVSATGNVQAPASLAVNFKSGGVLKELLVAPGQKVAKGQPLASIDDTDLQATLTNAQTGLTTAQARLVQTTMGLTPAEAAQNAISADQAQAAVDNANQSLADTQNLLALNANGYQTTIDQARAQQARDEATWLADSQQLANDQAQLAADQSAGNQQAITASTSKVAQSQTKVNADNAAIDKDRDQVQNALNAQTVGLTRDQQTLHNAQNALNSAIRSQESTLAANAVKTQPVKPGDLAAAQASVQSAQITVDNAQRSVDAATLVAPIDGTVATVNGKVGETIGTSGGSAAAGGGTTGAAAASSSSSSSSGFINLTDLTDLIVKAGFSETDAAKIQVDQPVAITLDALPAVRLTGKVAAVDTNATVVSNVVTYNVTISLDAPPATVKPGMTATTVVTVNQRENVLNVPSAAVQGSGANGTVTLIGPDGKQMSQQVSVGLRGDQSTEILSGLQAGEQIVLSQGGSFGSAAAGTRTGAGTGGAGTRTGVGGFGGGGLAGGGAGGGGAVVVPGGTGGR